jgi:hypothetical protein
VQRDQDGQREGSAAGRIGGDAWVGKEDLAFRAAGLRALEFLEVFGDEHFAREVLLHIGHPRRVIVICLESQMRQDHRRDPGARRHLPDVGSGVWLTSDCCQIWSGATKPRPVGRWDGR